MTFVCVTSIGVKSKYGSCSGNCTGLININNTQKKRKVPFVGMTGWTVNSIAKAVKGSSPFLPNNQLRHTLIKGYILVDRNFTTRF